MVIEYANQRRSPQWIPPAAPGWDYTLFGNPPSGPPPAQHIEMVFEKIPRGAGKFNSFTVNGKPYPHEDEFVLKEGTRYRLTFRNRTDDAHPLHLHRHLCEIAEIYGKPTSGVIKDTVVVPMYARAVVDFTADQPGAACFTATSSTIWIMDSKPF
jgi:FtsP/CotA-like multicopper oxidase with cupredoxin domain